MNIKLNPRAKPQIGLYAEEIEKAYDEVREDYPTAVAFKLSESEISFKNGAFELAVLKKVGSKASLDWFPKAGF